MAGWTFQCENYEREQFTDGAPIYTDSVQKLWIMADDDDGERVFEKW